MKKLIILLFAQLFCLNLIAQKSGEKNKIAWPEISWKGVTWEIKNGIYGPGPDPCCPNHWSSNNVYVDQNDHLHLKVQHDGTNWTCAEVQTKGMVDYGTYIVDFIYDTPDDIEDVDPMIVFSPFLYDHVSGHELDVEISQWGDPNYMYNTQFTIHSPYGNPIRSDSFQTESNNGKYLKYRSWISWAPDQILFKVFKDSLNGIGEGYWTLIDEWDFNSSNPDFDENYVPNVTYPGDSMRFHINYWLMNAIPPTNSQNTEVIITDYNYIPLTTVLSHNSSQNGIMIFASDFFDPDNGGNWFGDNTDMLNFITNDLNRNSVYISTRPLKHSEYGNSFYSDMGDFVEDAHNMNLKVYAMPMSDDSGYYYLPNYHDSVKAELKNKFLLYQNSVSSLEKFDGVYFDIEPWKDTIYYKPAKANDDYDSINLLIGHYLDLITELKSYYIEKTGDRNPFLAFATNKNWHKWYIDPNRYVPNASIYAFYYAGATCVVPQVYESRYSSNWTFEYDYDWFNKTGDYGRIWEYYASGDNVLLGLSAYNPIYTSNSVYLADESVINWTFKNSRGYFGSVLYGYGAAKYTNWQYSEKDPHHDTDEDPQIAKEFTEENNAVNNNELKITLTPNPTRGLLNICNVPEGSYDVFILSKHGETMLSTQNENIINVENLPPDIYYLVLIQGDSKHSILFSKD